MEKKRGKNILRKMKGIREWRKCEKCEEDFPVHNKGNENTFCPKCKNSNNWKERKKKSVDLGLCYYCGNKAEVKKVIDGVKIYLRRCEDCKLKRKTKRC